MKRDWENNQKLKRLLELKKEKTRRTDCRLFTRFNGVKNGFLAVQMAGCYNQYCVKPIAYAKHDDTQVNV